MIIIYGEGDSMGFINYNISTKQTKGYSILSESNKLRNSVNANGKTRTIQLFCGLELRMAYILLIPRPIH
jgi:hypothetical protein